MRKLTILVIAIAFVLLPLIMRANSCEHYWDELVRQCFTVTADEVDFDLCFSDSVFGPCPGGEVVLSYEDVQIINGVEYVTIVEMPLTYFTTFAVVVIEGLEFILIDDKLILLPESPLIFDRKQEENL